jgi:hypothetical protein
MPLFRSVAVMGLAAVEARSQPVWFRNAAVSHLFAVFRAQCSRIDDGRHYFAAAPLVAETASPM